MIPALIIAEKEFKDYLSSKRFLIIFGILILLSLYGVYIGTDNYNKQLDQYNKNSQLATDQHNGLMVTPMPSVLEAFNAMVVFLTYLGMVLGAAMGFDQISGEKDEKSLKFLITTPIHRDAIINGKTIGAIVTLAVALAAAFLIAIAIMMFKGIVPGIEDITRIVLFFVAALLYCMVFFAIAMAMSTVTKSTSMSVICTVCLVVVLILFSILSLIISPIIAHAIIGPAPPISYITNNITDSTGTIIGSTTTVSNDYMNYTNKFEATELSIYDTITMVSPVNDFGGMLGIGVGGIGNAILSKTKVQTASLTETGSATPYYFVDVSLIDSLTSIWVKIFVLIVEIIVAFAISYLVFMRMDI